MAKTCGKVKNCRPVGSNILVEMLTSQEQLGTKLIVEGTESQGPPQGYILDLGPTVDPKFGFEVGDRVLLQGSFVPVPKYGKSERQRGLIEPYVIKAVLIED